jgi:hypothetical protein
MEPDIDVTSTWPNAACDDMSDRPLKGFGGYLRTRWTLHIFSKNLLQTCRPAQPDISAYISTTFAAGYAQPHLTYQVHLVRLRQHPLPRLHQSRYPHLRFQRSCTEHFLTQMELIFEGGLWTANNGRNTTS